MFPQQYNLPGLLYNPYEFQIPPVNYRLDNPPCVPQNVNVPAALQFMYPAICAATANEATASASKHQGRMYVYNMLSVNNFNNNEFASAVQSVVDLMLFLQLQRMNSTDDMLLSNATAKTLSFITAITVCNNQSLMSIIPQQVVHQCRVTLEEAASIQNQILSMKNRGMPGQGGVAGYQQPFTNSGQFPSQLGQQQYPSFQGGNQFPSQPQQPQQWNNQQPQQFQGNNGFSGFPNNGGNQQPARYFPNGGGNQSVFQNAQPQQQAPIQPAGSDRYSYLKNNTQQPAPVAPAQYAAPVPQQQIAPPKVEQEIVTGDMWFPSEVQPYLSIYNPNTEKMVFKKIEIDTSRGRKTVIIGEVVGVDIMDRKAHTITTVKQAITAYIPPHMSTRDEVVSDALKNVQRGSTKITEAITAHVDGETEATSFSNHVEKRTSWIARNFLPEVLFDIECKKAANIAQDKTTSIAVKALLGVPFVCSDRIDSLFVSIQTKKSFVELTKRLRSELDGDSSQHVKKVINQLDKMLTDKLNSWVNNKLAIGLTIDSFIDDAVDLQDYIANKYGDMFAMAYFKMQPEFICAYLKAFDDESFRDDLKDTLIDPQVQESIHVDLLAHRYSITTVDVHSDELNFAIHNPGTGKVAVSAMIPATRTDLYEFAKASFEDQDSEGGDFAHNLIVTSDGKTFELHKGLLGLNTYLVSQF